MIDDRKIFKNGHIGLYPSSNLTDISEANIYIVTVPTPVDKNNRPILNPLIKASEMIGGFLKKKDIVIYESQYTLVVQKKTVCRY